MYKFNTSEYKNILVVNDDKSTNSWILASDYLIHCNCTTSVEAHILNKSSINFLGYSDKDVEHTLPKMFSSNVFSIDDLLNKIIEKDQNQQISDFKSNTDKAKKWLFNIDNITSSNIILKALNGFSNPINNKKDKNSNIASFIYYKFKRFLRNVFYDKLKKMIKGLINL